MGDMSADQLRRAMWAELGDARRLREQGNENGARAAERRAEALARRWVVAAAEEILDQPAG